LAQVKNSIMRISR